MFSGAEVLDGTLRVWSRMPPVVDVPCVLLLGRGAGAAIVSFQRSGPRVYGQTLAATQWNATAKTITVSPEGFLFNDAKQRIDIAPTVASSAGFRAAGITPTDVQSGGGSLILTAETVPTADLKVWITVSDVPGMF